MRGSVDAAHAIDGNFLDEQFGFNDGSVGNNLGDGGLFDDRSICGGNRAFHALKRTTHWLVSDYRSPDLLWISIQVIKQMTTESRGCT